MVLCCPYRGDACLLALAVEIGPRERPFGSGELWLE